MDNDADPVTPQKALEMMKSKEQQKKARSQSET